MNPRLFANLKSWVVGESVLDGIKAIAVKKLTAPRAAPARSSIADETDRGSDDGTSANPDIGGEYGFASGFTLESQFIESTNDTVHRAAANDVDFRTRAARGSGATDCYAAFSGVEFRPPVFVMSSVFIAEPDTCGRILTEGKYTAINCAVGSRNPACA